MIPSSKLPNTTNPAEERPMLFSSFEMKESTIGTVRFLEPSEVRYNVSEGRGTTLVVDFITGNQDIFLA